LGCYYFHRLLKAQENGHETTTGQHEATEEKLDPAKIIMDHIKDAHDFHFFTVGDFHASSSPSGDFICSGKG
jgi:F-type H+-transporting ATPase subunit a